MRRSLLGSRVYQEAEAMEAKMLLKLQELEVKLQESQETNHAAYWSGFEMFDFKEKCAYIIGHTFVFYLDTYNRPLEIMTTTSSSMFSPRYGSHVISTIFLTFVFYPDTYHWSCSLIFILFYFELQEYMEHPGKENESSHHPKPVTCMYGLVFSSSTTNRFV